MTPTEMPELGADRIGDEPTSWPVVATEVLGEGVIQTFVRDHVRTPTGDTMKRDYLRHTGAVGVIALDDDERVLAVRQYRHPVGFRLVEPPAGLLDVEGEDWLPAAQRELAEEAGMAASDWRVLVDYVTTPGCTSESLRIFLARGLSPVDRPSGFEAEGEEADMDVVWVPLTGLVDAIFAGRIQNPTMVVGALATQAAIRDGRLNDLRRPDAPWPARDVLAERASDLGAAGV